MAKRARSDKRILLLGLGRQDYISALKQKGYAVDGPCDLSQARLGSLGGRYDLVLLDFGADPRGALRLCQNIRRSSPRLRVVFLLDSTARLPDITCPPDDVVHGREGPEHVLERVEGLLAA